MTNSRCTHTRAVDIQGFLAASQARPRPVPASSVTAGLLGGLTAGATPGSAAAAPSAPPLPAPGLPPSLMGLYSPSRNTLASLDPARSIPRSAIQSSDVARYLQLQQLQALHIPPRDMRPGFIGFNPGLASILAQLGQPLASSFPHTDTLQALQQQRILALLQQQQERSVIQPLSAVNLQGPPLMAQSLQPSPRSQDPLLMSQMYQPSRPNLPLDLPVLLAQPDDELKLSAHQALLRHQIEAFRANEEDTSTHTRGRNKPIRVGQVGIRCRHCAHLPVSRRQKGSTYFPASLQGCYQAAQVSPANTIKTIPILSAMVSHLHFVVQCDQNMSTTHMQCGLCTEMPEQIKLEFSRLMATKVASSGAGRPYWAESAKRLGLMDTEDGIRYVRDLPTPADPATT